MLVGLPEAGKTTFVVALWHVASSDEVPESLTVDRFFEGDREYIQKARDRWLAYEQVGRNKNPDVQNLIRLTLRERSSDARPLQLTIPDLAGETFRQQFVERGWKRSFLQRLDETTALLLFINPNSVEEPFVIADAEAALDGWGEDGGEPEEDTGDSGRGRLGGELAQLSVVSDEGTGDHLRKEEEEFDFSDCCTAVKVVDLLQLLAEALPHRPMPLAVVVSAYDSLTGHAHYSADPSRYVRERLSLLDQYLSASPELFNSRIFGVSAQGGNYDQSLDVERLQSLETAAERIRIVTSDGFDGHDASEPLRWLAALSN
jgi:hypothetical protein